jgi:hypothetical protein
MQPAEIRMNMANHLVKMFRHFSFFVFTTLRSHIILTGTAAGSAGPGGGPGPSSHRSQGRRYSQTKP